MPDHLECSVLDPVERAVEFAVAPTENTALAQLSPDSMATAARYGSPGPLPRTFFVVLHVRYVCTVFVLTAVQIVRLFITRLAGHPASITKTGHRDWPSGQT